MQLHADTHAHARTHAHTHKQKTAKHFYSQQWSCFN